MRSSYWLVVRVVPADSFMAPRWTGGCEVKKVDFKTEGEYLHWRCEDLPAECMADFYLDRTRLRTSEV
jgi:hypothetical protein